MRCALFLQMRDRFHELAGKYFAGYSEINEEQMFTKGNFQIPLLNLEVMQSTAHDVEFIKKLNSWIAP